MGIQKNIDEQNQDGQRAHLIHSAFHATAILELDGTVVEISQAALDFSNLHKAELLGKPLGESLWFKANKLSRTTLGDAVASVAKGESSQAKINIQVKPAILATVEMLVLPLRSGNAQPNLCLVEIQDITSRRRIEEALETTNQHLQNIAGNLPGVIYQFYVKPDGDMGFSYVSEGAEQVFGVPAATVVGAGFDILGFLHPDERAGFLESVRASAQDLSPWHREMRAVVGGRTFWFSTQGTPRRMPDGSILWDGLALYIDQRKQAELLLAAEKQLLQQISANRQLDEILENICKTCSEFIADGTVSFMTLSKDGSELNLTANHDLPSELASAIASMPSGTSFSPCGEAVATGKPTIWSTSDKHAGHSDFARRMLTHGFSSAWSWPVTSAEGQTYGTLALLFASQNRELSETEKNVIGRLSDIASIALHRDRTQQQLDAQAARIELAAQASQEGMWYWDAEKNDFWLSDTFTQITGFSADDQPDTLTAIRMLIHPDDLDKFDTTTRRYFSGYQLDWPYDSVWRLRGKDGEYRWMRARGTALYSDTGKLCSASGTYVDITDQKLEMDRISYDNARYRTMLDNAPDAILVFDVDSGKFSECNQNACALFGCSEEEIFSRVPADFRPQSEQDPGASVTEDQKRLIGQVLAGHTPVFEGEYKVAGGETAICEVRLVRVPHPERRLIRASILDITHRLQIEKELFASNERLNLAVNGTSDGLWDWKLDTKEAWYAPRFRELLGYTDESDLPDTPDAANMLFFEEEREMFQDRVREAFRDPANPDFELHMRCKDGEGRWFRVRCQTLSDEAGNIVRASGSIQDISVAHELSERLTYHASHDSVTGLSNRRAFDQAVQQALLLARSNHQNHAVCFLDLDQFRIINDACGHIAGDEMLSQAAALMKDGLRKQDTIARLGGDEFGILLQNCSLEKATEVCEKIIEELRDFRFIWDGSSFVAGASVGIAPITAESQSVTMLLSAADAACFEAKNAGRNRVKVFHGNDEEYAQRQTEMHWVNRVKDAIKAQRFVLHAQVIWPIRPEDDKLNMELLIRLLDEDGGLVSPGAFMPAVERFDLSPLLDMAVIHSALDWLRENQAELDRLNKISINVAGPSLIDNRFLETVSALITDHAVFAPHICFEITETAAIANLNQAQKFIETLKGLGCSFALDDFGSGLSSFGYLKNLPVDYLKIDGMFVRDIARDSIDFAMVRSINEIGHVMGKKTVAEFVEDAASLRTLKLLRVDMAQGFGLSKPQPLSEIDLENPPTSSIPI